MLFSFTQELCCQSTRSVANQNIGTEWAPFYFQITALKWRRGQRKNAIQLILENYLCIFVQAHPNYTSRDKAKEAFIEIARALGSVITGLVTVSWLPIPQGARRKSLHVPESSDDLSCKRLIEAPTRLFHTFIALPRIFFSFSLSLFFFLRVKWLR